MHHVLKYAESDDGINWRRDGKVILGLGSPEEYALCRPWVLRNDVGYGMWFCHRGNEYRLGYAESCDGVNWERRDDLAGLDVSEHGWDSEMIAYPSLCEHRGRRYLFYNGNSYGHSGFGVAVAD
jgi:hypothetical protein